MIILFLLLLTSCEWIVLKKGAKLPYRAAAGRYSFNLYRVEYPQDLKMKEKFLIQLSNAISDLVVRKKRVMILLSESFFHDLLNIEREGFLKSESFLYRGASELSLEEIDTLLEVSGREKRKYKVQELLHFQIEYILTLLGNARYFDHTKVYTEREKEQVIEELYKVRNRVVNIFKRHLDLFVEVDSVYQQDEKESFEYKKHYYSKDIHLNKKGLFRSFDEYRDRATIVIKDMTLFDIHKLLTSEIKLNLKEYVILNQEYSGYALRDSMIYLTGGDRELSDNVKYKISIHIKSVSLSELEDIQSSSSLKSLYRHRN